MTLARLPNAVTGVYCLVSRFLACGRAPESIALHSCLRHRQSECALVTFPPHRRRLPRLRVTSPLWILTPVSPPSTAGRQGQGLCLRARDSWTLLSRPQILSRHSRSGPYHGGTLQHLFQQRSRRRGPSLQIPGSSKVRISRVRTRVEC